MQMLPMVKVATLCSCFGVDGHDRIGSDARADVKSYKIRGRKKFKKSKKFSKLGCPNFKLKKNISISVCLKIYTCMVCMNYTN